MVQSLSSFQCLGGLRISVVSCWCVINLFEKIISLVLMDRESELLVIGVVFFGSWASVAAR